MPSHQQRRAALPADYPFPSHGVDCDCVTCRRPLPSGWSDNQANITGATFELHGVTYVVGAPFVVSPGFCDNGTVLEPTADTPWAV